MDVWRVDHSSAVVEDFEDEIVILHPSAGTFFSLRGRAADVWRGLDAGVAVAEVADAVAQLPAAEAVVLRDMMEQLGLVGIIAAGEGQPTAKLDLGQAPAEFSRNDEFDDLIRLDPIHDVDERGWPYQH